MTIYRSHILPQVVLTGFIAAIAVLGILRSRSHLDFIHSDQEELRLLDRGINQSQQLYTLLDQATVAHNQFQNERSTAHRQALDSTLATLVASSQAAAALRDELYHQQLHTMIVQMGAPSAGEIRPALRQELVQARALWNALNGQLVKRYREHSQRLLERQRRILNECSIGFALLVVCAVVYLYTVNFYLAKPIRSLAETARQVTSGNLRARATHTGDGPVSTLANDFNHMVDILVDSLYKEERANRELQQRNTELAEANEHKTHFLATVSHELKTPLNAIIGFADILQTEHHGPLEPRQREYINRVFSAGKHLLSMITDLIDVAKIDMKTMALQPQPVNGDEVVAEVIEMLAPQITEKEHEIHHSPIPDVPMVVVDRKRLKQIVVNLLSNAVKFTPVGGRIEVACTADQDRYQIVVSDTGIGIAEENQSKVFDDFVQLDSRLQRQHEGTGIGLALCRRLTELMDGSLTLASTPGEGSRFTVVLPMSANGEAVPEQPSPNKENKG